MIRTTALWLFIAGVGMLSFRDWFRATLGLVALIAVVEHPDFPKSLAGIQGLNPWNVLLAVCVISWLVNRRKEGIRWDFPGNLAFLLLIYVGFMMTAFIRASNDLGAVIQFSMLMGNDDVPTFAGLFSEHVINCLKWMIPAIMIYDGCRSERRLLETVVVIVGVYFLLAVQIIKWMPFSAISEGDMSERALKILSNEVGFHRVNLSMMMSGAAWAAMYAAGIFQQRYMRLGFYFMAFAITLAMTLTGGRTGYVTWVIMGLGYAWLRNPKMLLFLPFVAMIAIPMVPGLSDRLFAGFGDNKRDQNTLIENQQQLELGGKSKVDLYTVTSGRTFAWPFVLDKIQEKPLLGYGKLAMQRTGLSYYLMSTYGEDFPHPHNMYLEWTFDNGLLALIPVLMFYGTILTYAFRMLRGPPIESGVGGMTIALVGSLFIAGMGSQTFYPREGAVAMWVAMLVTVRWYFLKYSALKANKGVLAAVSPYHA
ncbi:MAG: O-antigen ligase family protein [Pseudomonadales bacterium]|nr:O-antigen ligase family protein [Pseudomonadales bacterium]MCP5185807.1 O-antigen ligase family protein [Pseudomonadales bacterium]